MCMELLPISFLPVLLLITLTNNKLIINYILMPLQLSLYKGDVWASTNYYVHYHKKYPLYNIQEHMLTHLKSFFLFLFFLSQRPNPKMFSLKS